MRDLALQARALHLAQQDTLSACRRALDGVDWLLLKGAALGTYLYPDPAWRPGSDIDLLVAPDQAGAALERLSGVGLIPGLAVDGALVFQARALQDRREGFQVYVDLHWSLSSRPVLAGVLTWEALWAHARDTQAGRVLHPAHALLHAVMHRYGHHFRAPERLIWLLDLHQLWCGFDAPGRDRIASLAVDLGIGGLLLGMLSNARAWLDTPIPPSLEQSLKRCAARERSARLLQDPAPGFWYDLGSVPLARRLTYLGQQLFPSVHYMRHRYPNSRWPLPLLYLRRAVDGWSKQRR